MTNNGSDDFSSLFIVSCFVNSWCKLHFPKLRPHKQLRALLCLLRFPLGMRVCAAVEAGVCVLGGRWECSGAQLWLPVPHALLEPTTTLSRIGVKFSFSWIWASLWFAYNWWTVVQVTQCDFWGLVISDSAAMPRWLGHSLWIPGSPCNSEHSEASIL